MPWLNQLVMMCSQAPEPNSKSPSLEMMLRAQVSFLRLARISAQISAIGVRDIVLPPMPTDIAVAHERGGFVERHDLLAQAAVALREVVAQFVVGM